MSEREPVEVKNLDRYGSVALAWSRAREALVEATGPADTFFLGTCRPDGTPDAAGVGAMWHQGDLYVTSGPGTRKARNLASNPRCTDLGSAGGNRPGPGRNRRQDRRPGCSGGGGGPVPRDRMARGGEG